MNIFFIQSVKLNNLAFYWNSSTSTYLEGAKESVYNTLKEKIATNQRKVKEHQWRMYKVTLIT